MYATNTKEYRRPYIIVFTTATVDGKIASRTGFSMLSCPEDKRRQFWLRSRVDAVIVGVNTVIVDDPTIRPKEFSNIRGKYYRVVLDGRLRIPENARILDTSQYPTIIVTSSRSDREKISRLRRRGVEVLELDTDPPLPIDLVLEKLLEDYGIRIAMVEGGGNTIWSFAKFRAIDEIRITYAPLIFGGFNAISLATGEGFANAGEALKLEPILLALCLCRKEVHIIYRVIEPLGIPIERPEIGTLMNFSLVLDLRR